MKKIKFLFLFLFLFIMSIALSSNLTAQSNISSKYPIEDMIVYAKIIDTLNKMLKFEFYEEKLNHFETAEFALNPFDSITIFHPETYEETLKMIIEYKIEKDSLNYEEAKLFRSRMEYPEGVFLIGKINRKDVHKDVNLNEHLKLKDYPDLNDIEDFNEHILSDNKIGKFTVFPITKDNSHKYKYVVKAYLMFSAIKWNTNKEYAIVECGYHHKSKKIGTTGGGFQVIVQNIRGEIKLIKGIGLWEE